MDLMKDIYKKELRTRIAAWEGDKQLLLIIDAEFLSQPVFHLGF